MKRRTYCAFIYILICCSVLFAVPASADEGEKQVLTVAFPETAGINEVYEDGTYGGITYDMLMEVAKYTGWEYEFIHGDISNILSEMMDG